MAKKDDSAVEKMMKELDEALQKDAKDQKAVEIRKAEEPKPKIPALKLPEEAPGPAPAAEPAPEAAPEPTPASEAEPAPDSQATPSDTPTAEEGS